MLSVFFILNLELLEENVKLVVFVSYLNLVCFLVIMEGLKFETP